MLSPHAALRIAHASSAGTACTMHPHSPFLMCSGTPLEAKCAKKIMPVIRNSHHLLVTLLLCNAGAMEVCSVFFTHICMAYLEMMLGMLSF